MATRKPAKKATKKTTAKKAVRKNARRPKAEVDTTVECGVNYAADSDSRDANLEEIQARIIDDLRERLNDTEALNESLTKQLYNPSNLAEQLFRIGKVVFVDLVHLHDNPILRAVIAHGLGVDGYEHAFGAARPGNSVSGIKAVVGASILRLNTVNRTFTCLEEHEVAEGTMLVRIEPITSDLNFKIESTRFTRNTVTFDDVTYRRVETDN